MKELFVFKINTNTRNDIGQGYGRDEIIKLLEIVPIQFQLKKNADGKDSRYVSEQEFAFETAEECRTFALRILRTETIFYCELKKVKVK